MKKINIILTGALMLAGLCSCSDFLTREPTHKFVQRHISQAKQSLRCMLTVCSTGWLPNSSETNGGDAYNDLIATKTGTDFYRPGAHWDAAKQGGWGTGD